MSQESRLTWALKIPKTGYEKVRPTLRILGILDPEYEPRVEGDYIFVPAIRNAYSSNLDKIPIMTEIVQRQLKLRKRRPKDLRDALSAILPKEVLRDFRRSFDIVGDTVIIEPTDIMKIHRSQMVEALRSIHPNIRMILAKTSPISGEERIASYETWFGEGPTETIHKEHGCTYLLDMTKVFFTPRLSTERKRVASLVGQGEAICDLFAGIGPFSILIAKTQISCKVFACDINPAAYEYLSRNVSLNKVASRVKPFLGNARALASSRLKRTADRVIMNLPKGAELYLDAALDALSEKGGVIHLYLFRSEQEDGKRRVDQITSEMCGLGASDVQVLLHKKVREVAPFLYNEVVDLRVTT